jgi:hypothetical protein
VPPRLEVDLALLVPDVERDLAAVARPPLAPAARFLAVVPLRLDERDVPLADRLRLVPEPEELRVPVVLREPDPLLLDVDRERVLLAERRGVAARTREIASSPEVSSATGGLGTASGSCVKPGSPNGSSPSSRLSPSKLLVINPPGRRSFARPGPSSRRRRFGQRPPGPRHRRAARLPRPPAAAEPDAWPSGSAPRPDPVADRS